MAAHAMFLLAVMPGIQAWKCMQQANVKDNDKDWALEVLIGGVVKSLQIKELKFSR